MKIIASILLALGLTLSAAPAQAALGDDNYVSKQEYKAVKGPWKLTRVHDKFDIRVVVKNGYTSRRESISKN